MNNKLLISGFLCVLLGTSHIVFGMDETQQQQQSELDKRFTITKFEKDPNSPNFTNICLENNGKISMKSATLLLFIDQTLNKITSDQKQLDKIPFCLGNTTYYPTKDILTEQRKQCLPTATLSTEDDDTTTTLKPKAAPPYSSLNMDNYTLINNTANGRTFLQSCKNDKEITEINPLTTEEISKINESINHKLLIMLNIENSWKPITEVKDTSAQQPYNSPDCVIEQFTLDFDNNTNEANTKILEGSINETDSFVFNEFSQVVQTIRNLYVTDKGQKRKFIIILSNNDASDITRGKLCSIKFNKDGVAYHVKINTKAVEKQRTNINDQIIDPTKQSSSNIKPILIVGGIGSVIAMITAYLLFPDKMAQLLQSLKNLAFKRAT